MKNLDSKKWMTLGAIALVVVMVGALALTLNGSSLQGALKVYRPSSSINNYQINKYSGGLKPYSPEPKPQSPEPVPASQAITRAEFAGLVAVHMKGLNMVNKTNCFIDTVGNPYENAICALHEVGLLYGDKDANGNPLGKFRPNDYVNRAEAAKFFVQAFASNMTFPPAYQGTIYYNDVQPSMWYFNYVKTLADMKMVDILPSPNSNYYPAYTLSKGRAQYMINNAIAQGLAQ